MLTFPLRNLLFAIGRLDGPGCLARATPSSQCRWAIGTTSHNSPPFTLSPGRLRVRYPWPCIMTHSAVTPFLLSAATWYLT